MEIIDHTQIIFKDIRFQCSGNITQVQTWYQIPGINIKNVFAFQIWHPINDTYFKLLSEVFVPPAVHRYTPVTISNLSLPFFNGSVVGIFMQFPGEGFYFNSILNHPIEDVPESPYSFGDKFCNVNVLGNVIVQGYSPEIVISYGMYSHYQYVLLICVHPYNM